MTPIVEHMHLEIASEHSVGTFEFVDFAVNLVNDDVELVDFPSQIQS